MKRAIAFAALTAACAGGASAENWSGNLGFTYALPSDSEDQTITEYFGGIEYAINRNFSIGLDLAGYDFEDIDADLVSSTWHFIYHLDDETSFGLFAGADVVEADTVAGTLSDSATVAGLEAGTEFGPAEGEAYIGVGLPDEGDDFTILGLSGEYDIAEGWSAIGSFDRQSEGDFSANVFAIGVEYEIVNGPEIFGKIGQRSASLGDFDDDSQFIEIGASVSFGRERGTTFERRSLFEALPNF